MGPDNNATTIIIALIALIGTLAAAIVWVLKWAVRNYGDDIKAHTNAANKLAKASDNLSKSVNKNTHSNQEVLTFMKNLNGKLAKATIQTVKEQNVEHQVIQEIKKEAS